MKHLQNHNVGQGLTLIEVMLALFIVGALLTTLFMTENVVFTRIVNYSSRIDHIFLLKQRLFQAAFDRAQGGDEKTKHQEATNKPENALVYEEKKPSQNSALKDFESIVIEYVSSSWTDIMGKQKEVIINLIYKPEKK